jgi:hypothetical protein
MAEVVEQAESTIPTSAGSSAQPAPGPGAAAPAPTDWHATLPEDLRKDGTLSRYKEPVDAFKALIEANKTIGKGVQQRPDPTTATPEQMNAWRTSQGIPLAPDGYELPEVLDPKAVETFRGEFHKLGIPASAAKQLAERYVAFEQERLDRMQQGWVAEIGQIRKEWGEPLWNQRFTAATRAIEVAAQEAGYSPEQLRGFLDSTRIGDHPMLFKIFAVMGEKLKEDGWISGDTSAPGDAKQRIAEIRGNPKHPAMDVAHPGHREAFEALQDLYRLAYGTREAGPG